MAIGMCQFGGI